MEEPNRTRPVRFSPIRLPALVKVWRWKVGWSTRPIPFEWALPMVDAVFASLADTGWTISGSRRLPLCLHGPENPEGRGWNHEHAFFLPEDTDNDGFFDHLSVFATAGLDPAALRLLLATEHLVLDNMEEVYLVPERMGGLDCTGHFGEARVWISRTAYVPPNGRPRSATEDAGERPPDAARRRKDAAKQLKYEIKKRGLSSPLAVGPTVVPHLDFGFDWIDPKAFAVESSSGDRPPMGALPYFFCIEFTEEVSGPLAFGWACHRGLGQFVPLLGSTSL